MRQQPKPQKLKLNKNKKQNKKQNQKTPKAKNPQNLKN